MKDIVGWFASFSLIAFIIGIAIYTLIMDRKLKLMEAEIMREWYKLGGARASSANTSERTGRWRK